ncbi:pentatricopeptide repeat-containing protein At3g24000, mitochondrial-like [Rhododendron vialii]|uniref:pentatricopeptide repeat-containing protein At3g24000, mitochondrial-like n=1 Tax=Rhododendron vialii TaxID=182163 RepID=UPI00265D9232|nr:pentatricopeptide repeat-containing protein At3g24000, mitochondrial-like [Rhododendron vialii]
MYADCGDSESAHILLDKMPQPKVFAWTAILSVYWRHGMSDECIGFFCEMKVKGAIPYRISNQVYKDVVTYGAELNLQVRSSLIDVRNTATLRVLDGCLAKMVFGFVGSKRLEGFVPDLVTWNMAMDVYYRMGQCDEAWKIFEQIEEPNIISWTTLISGHSRIEKHEVTLAIFMDMVRRGDGFPDLDCISRIIVSC